MQEQPGVSTSEGMGFKFVFILSCGVTGTWGLLSSGVWTELPRPRGARTASLRADVAATAGRITLPALCWYPLETGLRREAAEVLVVNVGSPHSQRGLSHKGSGGKHHGVSQAETGRTPTAWLSGQQFLLPPATCHPSPSLRSPGSTRGPKRHLPL